MNHVKFNMNRAVIVRRVIDDDPYFCFRTRCGQNLRVMKEKLSIEVRSEIDSETTCPVLDLLLGRGATHGVAVLAAGDLETLEKLFQESNTPFPGLRCALATPA